MNWSVKVRPCHGGISSFCFMISFCPVLFSAIVRCSDSLNQYLTVCWVWIIVRDWLSRTNIIVSNKSHLTWSSQIIIKILISLATSSICSVVVLSLCESPGHLDGLVWSRMNIKKYNTLCESAEKCKSLLVMTVWSQYYRASNASTRPNLRHIRYCGKGTGPPLRIKFFSICSNWQCRVSSHSVCWWMYY